MSASRRIWLLAVEHGAAPHMHGRLGAEAEEGLPLARLDAQRDQQAVARRRDRGAEHRDGEGAAAVLGEIAPLELRFEDAVDLGERNVDRHADGDTSLVDLLDDLELRRERAIRLGLARRDARLGLQPERQRDGVLVDPRLRREGAGRAHLEPQIGRIGRPRP